MSDRRLSPAVVPEPTPPVAVAAAGRTRKASLLSAAMVATLSVNPVSPASSPSSSPTKRKPVAASSERRPTLATVGMAAMAIGFGAASSSSATTTTTTPLVGSPQPPLLHGGIARVPSSRHMAAAAISSSSLKKKQQLALMRTTRRSFSSSSGALDAQRIELFFHVPTLAELQRLRVPRALTLIGLQAIVQREFAIPYEDQRLYWHGDLLEGDDDLAVYDIHDQSVLNLRVRKRYRPIGDVFTKIKTVVPASQALTKPGDYAIVEIVAPLPPTHVVFKRLVTVITYLQRLDALQAQRTQRRVWKQKVAFWDEHTASASSTARRSSQTPIAKTTRSGSAHSETDADASAVVVPLPSAFVKLHSGPERVSYVVTLAHTHAIAQRLQLASDQRTPSDLRHMKKWLASLKFFASASLPDTALHEIARASVYVRIRAGDFLFRQGDVGDHFYIVVSGCVSLAAFGNGFFATMTPGDCFGEISLSAGSKGRRTASATVNFAAPVAELALLSGEIYRRVINPYKKAVLETTETALYSVPQLRVLPDHVITHVAYASKRLDAKPGRLLVRRGEDLNVLVVLVKGEVKVSATATDKHHHHQQQQPACAFPVVSVVSAPAVFCQEAVLATIPSPAPWDIETLDACSLLCFRTDTISIFLAPHMEIIRALKHEHTQRLQDFERRFAQYAPRPSTDNKGAENNGAGVVLEESSRRRPTVAATSIKFSTKASYMRLLTSQRSVATTAEDRARRRRGAATHVEFPRILLRHTSPDRSKNQRDDDDAKRHICSQPPDPQRPLPSSPAIHEAAGRSCADVQDEFLHRALPFGEILALRDQIQFCSFAAQELQAQDHHGRTRALLRGLRQLPVEDVEMVPSSDADDGIHFRFTPRPPTSPATVSSSSAPPLIMQTPRRNLQTR